MGDSFVYLKTPKIENKGGRRRLRDRYRGMVGDNAGNVYQDREREAPAPETPPQLDLEEQYRTTPLYESASPNDEALDPATENKSQEEQIERGVGDAKSKECAEDEETEQRPRNVALNTRQAGESDQKRQTMTTWKRTKRKDQNRKHPDATRRTAQPSIADKLTSHRRKGDRDSRSDDRINGHRRGGTSR